MILEGWDEIIGIRFNTIIMSGQPALDKMIQENNYDQLISRAEFRFMSKLDLGDKWGQFAETALTLFKLESCADMSIRNPNPMTIKKIF